MPILTGLAIGAALGGGIAALRGGRPEDILKGAVIGGATGAIGGGISGALQSGTAGTVAATGADAVAATGTNAVAIPVEGMPYGPPLGEMYNQQGITSLLQKATTSQSAIDLNSAGNSLGGGDGAEVVMRGLRVPNSSVASNVAPSSTEGVNVYGIRPPVGFMNQTPKPDGFFDSGIGKFMSNNKGILGAGALGLMALKPQSNTGNQEETGYIRPYTFNQERNPDYAGAGTPYFKQSYTAQTPVKASDFGATTVANGGIIRMAEGGEAEPSFENTQEQRESVVIPTLGQLAAIQQAQPTYQPPMVAQGITQPLIAPQMAQVQQRYAPVQRQAPEAFNYQAPAFVKYANVGGGGAGGAGGGGGEAIDPVTKKPIQTAAQIIASKPKPTAGGGGGGGGGSGIFDTYGNELGPRDIYDGPGYYERYPVADVYDYENNMPTRPNNPNEGSPQFNIPSNFPVDPSSGLSSVQQAFANQGYTDFIPDATTDYYGNTGANGGLVYNYAMGGGIGSYYSEPDDGARNYNTEDLNKGPQYPMQQGQYAGGGGIYNLGGYSDGGRLLKGPGDGVSDSIPAQIGQRQPARLADGEFVVPARTVSELGNGSTDAGAKQLYAMMDRVQKNRAKTIGKGKIAVDSKSSKYLPA